MKKLSLILKICNKVKQKIGIPINKNKVSFFNSGINWLQINTATTVTNKYFQYLFNGINTGFIPSRNACWKLVSRVGMIIAMIANSNGKNVAKPVIIIKGIANPTIPFIMPAKTVIRKINITQYRPCSAFIELRISIYFQIFAFNLFHFDALLSFCYFNSWCFFK